MDLPDDIKVLFNSIIQPVVETSGISVIIPIRGAERNPSLMVCIDYILKQRISPLEIIVVEESPVKEIDLGKHKDNVRYLHIEGGRYFNKSKCINTGVMNAEYNIINMNDVDMIMPINYLWKYYQRLQNFDMCFMSKDIYYLDKVPCSDGDFSWNGSRWTDGRKWDYAGGNFSVKKNKFIEIGGMDEQFEGYGGEDGDFYVRSQRLLKFDKMRDILSPLLHMPHVVNLDNKEQNDKRFKTINKFDKNRIEILRHNLKKSWVIL